MTHDHCMLCTLELRATEATRETYRLALVAIAACTSPQAVAHGLAIDALAHEHGKPVAT